MNNSNELGVRPVQTEVQLGVCGPAISDAELKRIQDKVDAEVREKEYNQARLDIEERRAGLDAEDRRRRVARKITESPHRHYFVRRPGL